MSIAHSVFILSVCDLPASRLFYRDILGLGDPSLDSNFWVEFSLSDGASFCLEQSAQIPPPPPGRIACLFEVHSVEEFRKRYEDHGFISEADSAPHQIFGISAYAFTDIEKNTFWVTDERSK